MDWEFEKIQPVTAQDNTGHYQLEEKVSYVRPLNFPPATDLNMSPVKIDVSFSTIYTIGLFKCVNDDYFANSCICLLILLYFTSNKILEML